MLFPNLTLRELPYIVSYVRAQVDFCCESCTTILRKRDQVQQDAETVPGMEDMYNVSH